VNDVPDPRIEQPNDLVVRVSSTAICGSDLHLYGPLTPFMTPGDILGHVAVDGQYAHTPPVEGDPDERDDPRERLDDDFDVASAREQNHEQRQSNPNEAPGDGDPSVVDGS